MSMTRNLVLFCVVVLIGNAGVVMAGHKGGHEHMSEVTGGVHHDDVEKHKGCPHCGMDRGKFAHSRMLITYVDGATVGVCSIHCAVTELKANKGKDVKTVEVADLNTRKLVAAEKASWVIGGSKKGIMTRTAKWAFTGKEAAQAFIKMNGGRLSTFKEALAAAEKD